MFSLPYILHLKQNYSCPKKEVVNKIIHILDFDWAGEKGEARYPLELNTSCNWPLDVECGEHFAKEHDA